MVIGAELAAQSRVERPGLCGVRCGLGPGQVLVRTWSGPCSNLRVRVRVRVSKGANHCISSEPLDLFLIGFFMQCCNRCFKESWRRDI